jgi:hypothetical protein
LPAVLLLEDAAEVGRLRARECTAADGKVAYSGKPRAKGEGARLSRGLKM